MRFSKSGYCGYLRCPRSVWLQNHRPELLPETEAASAEAANGIRIGRLAHDLFAGSVDVTVRVNDAPDLGAMLRRTAEELAKGTSAICEASFEYQGLYCAVDVLKKDGDGWSVYEVKSSAAHAGAKNKHPEYVCDVAYQKYVLEKCGLKIVGTYLVCVNADYIFDGNLDLRQFFLITDLTEDAEAEKALVAGKLAEAERVLSSAAVPEIDLGPYCFAPDDCVFWNFCAGHVPSPSVFDLYRMQTGKKLELYRAGIVSFPELLQSGKIKSDKQLRQIEYALADKGTWCDAAKIRSFLSTLSYPLYFLDFETMQPAVPFCVGTKPYAQIPFQYSLHFIEAEGGELKHREFLAESGTDPRRALAERLCEDIPENVCVTAYNKAFECTRIRELAEAFPDLADHLLNVRDHVADLLDPFQDGFYYNRAMGGSFSIKSVLPAIFPDDPSLDYHNLEGVHNGSEAMTVFPEIRFMPPAEQAQARENLLRYCELDTFAMVKVWQELVRVSGEA